MKLAEPQKKQLDLLKKVENIDYPICNGALCTGNKCCPITDDNGLVKIHI